MVRPRTMLTTLHERRARHLERKRIYRVAFAVSGFLVLVAGIVLALPLVPGPGLLLVAIGLGMLALEFSWAERLLTRTLLRLERGVERLQRGRRARPAVADPDEEAGSL